MIPDPATAILKSRTKRFSDPKGSEGIDGGGYNTDTVLTAQSTQTVLDSTPLQYHNIRTKTDRFGKDFKDKRLDKVRPTTMSLSAARLRSESERGRARRCMTRTPGTRCA